MIPKGYLQANFPISQGEAAKVRIAWQNAMSKGETIVLGNGIHFVQFQQDVFDKAIIQCGYCGQWAAIQTECKHCGAMIR